MSHFSKIKTRITDLEVLKKTIKDLGFFYRCSLDTSSSYMNETLFVYDSEVYITQVPSCSFEWNSNQYLLIVDLGLWNLDIDFNYFTDRLLQQYAYNIVIKHSNSQGFNCITEDITESGSINLVLQKF